MVNIDALYALIGSTMFSALPLIAGGIIAITIFILFYIQFRDDILGDVK